MKKITILVLLMLTLFAVEPQKADAQVGSSYGYTVTQFKYWAGTDIYYPNREYIVHWRDIFGVWQNATIYSYMNNFILEYPYWVNLTIDPHIQISWMNQSMQMACGMNFRQNFSNGEIKQVYLYSPQPQYNPPIWCTHHFEPSVQNPPNIE